MDGLEVLSQAAAEAEPPKKRRKRKRGPCRRFWCFVDNGEKGTGGKDLIAEQWKELPAGVTYLSWQLEVGEKTGHPHV